MVVRFRPPETAGSTPTGEHTASCPSAGEKRSWPESVAGHVVTIVPGEAAPMASRDGTAEIGAQVTAMVWFGGDAGEGP